MYVFMGMLQFARSLLLHVSRDRLFEACSRHFCVHSMLCVSIAEEPEFLE